METKRETNKYELLKKKTVVGRGDAPFQKARLGTAEYSKTIGQNDSSEERESDNELYVPEIIGVSLNLSKKKIKNFPESLLSKIDQVQYLYLEGNRLTELPKCFFQTLQRLQWLDLRNNSLTCLPTDGLKNHPSLEFILLQGNRIRNLPVELATIPSLKGLQISGNPIINVPYDAIAEGFHGLIKHLRKLYTQENILLPGTESVVVKPSTSRGNSENPPRLEVTEPCDSELTMWDLDGLSQWRQFMKKKSQGLDNSSYKYYTTKASKDRATSQPKISVSVRSQSKPPLKLKPFRCGVLNKNKHRTTMSALHFMKMRRTRLGYKRKPITPAQLQEKAEKEAFNAQIREILEKQAKKIQRMKDKDALKAWRDHARFTRQQLKLLDNFQQYPSKDFASKTPFDVDPEFLNMLNRVDIYRSLKEYDSKHKRIKKPKARISALDLERQMDEIIEKLKKLDTNDVENNSPRTKHSHVCDKMHKIMDIQKTLKNLQTLNSSMSGITPLIKPKPKNYFSKK